MSVLERNSVTVRGSGERALIFVHGYGCDQNMWRFVAPQFEDDYKVVTYDLTGMGNSDLSAYDFQAYSSLERHADDLIEILKALDASAAIAVGHSVGATIAGLVARREPAWGWPPEKGPAWEWTTTTTATSRP